MTATGTYHIATLNAYEIKGGGFRGVYFVRETKTRVASEVLETLEAAKFFAKTKAHEAHAAEGYTLAPVYKKGEYYANVWVPVN